MLSVFDFASHLFVHWHVYAAFPANPFCLSRSNFHYFFGLFYFFFNTFHLVCFCNVLMLLGSLGITLSVVGHLRVAQITAYCANYLTKRVNTSSSKSEPGKHSQQQQQHQQKKINVNFTSANFSVFLRQVDDFLVALADANRVAGSAIFGFVMTNLPMNALIILMLAKGANCQRKHASHHRGLCGCPARLHLCAHLLLCHAQFETAQAGQAGNGMFSGGNQRREGRDGEKDCR